MHRSDVVEGPVAEPGHHGRERRLVFRVRRRGQTAHGASMEAIMEGHDLVLLPAGGAYAANLAAEFDGGFIGFAAAVADEDFAGFTHCAAGYRVFHQ